MATRVRASLATILAITMTLALAHRLEAQTRERRASEFTLSNGMQVVVVPDHRAPVVTHMVWYRVGAADEPQAFRVSRTSWNT